VQDAITEALTRAIAPAVADAELRRALGRSPDNLGAWEAYQRGLWHAGKANAADNEVALGFFRRAIELDPAFASPHSMLAQNYGWGFASGAVRPVSDIMALAEEEARRAIELDADDPTAHAVLSWICMCNAEHGAAMERAERALAIAPSDPFAWLAKARVLVFSGRPREATEAIATLQRLSPRGSGNWMAMTTLVIGHYFLGNYATAADLARRLMREQPGLTAPYRWLAASLGQLERLDEAGNALREALKRSGESFEFNVLERPPWFRVADHAHMVEGLRKAGWAG
jgi:adenylate cyclase